MTKVKGIVIKQPSELTADLKVFQSLKPQSKVEVPSVSRTTKSVRTESQRLQKKPLKAKAPQTQSLSSTSRKLLSDFSNDLWAEQNTGNQLKELEEEQEYLRTQKTRSAPARIFNKPNLVPAIELPHAGSSYNPSKQDLQKLTKLVVKKELKKISKDQDVSDSLIEKKSWAQKDKEYLDEMMEGLVSDEDEGFDDEEEESIGTENIKKIPDRLGKTSAQRRKEKKVKVLMKKLAVRKAAKRRQSTQVGVKNVMKQLNQEEAKIDQRIERRAARFKRQLIEGKGGKMFVTGKGRIPVKDQVVPLPADLKGNLRSVKMEGNLLKDRFNSLMRRSLIETRSKVTSKIRSRYKRRPTKSYIKTTQREDEGV